MTAPIAAKPESRLIPLELIDPPDVAMRETMDEAGLESLTATLREIGQLQELVVIAVGGRYRIADGHRRSVCLPRAGFTEARCFVFPEGTALEQAIKVIANDEREAVNPAAEATYYRHLLDTQCDGDIDRLCTLVRRKEAHVQARLDLTRGWPQVMDALRAGEITLAVARQLNRVKSAFYLTSFIADAVRFGWSERVARQQVQELERTLRLQEATADGSAAPVEPSTAAPISSIDACPLCSSGKDQHDMTYVRVHRSCLAVMQREQDMTREGGGR